MPAGRGPTSPWGSPMSSSSSMLGNFGIPMYPMMGNRGYPGSRPWEMPPMSMMPPMYMSGHMSMMKMFNPSKPKLTLLLGGGPLASFSMENLPVEIKIEHPESGSDIPEMPETETKIETETVTETETVRPEYPDPVTEPDSGFPENPPVPETPPVPGIPEFPGADGPEIPEVSENTEFPADTFVPEQENPEDNNDLGDGIEPPRAMRSDGKHKNIRDNREHKKWKCGQLRKKGRKCKGKKGRGKKGNNKSKGSKRKGRKKTRTFNRKQRSGNGAQKCPNMEKLSTSDNLWLLGWTKINEINEERIANNLNVKKCREGSENIMCSTGGETMEQCGDNLGSPFVTWDGANEFILVGVVSKGGFDKEGCGIAKKPDVFRRITNQDTDWIKQVVGL